MKDFLIISKEVRDALKKKNPVVAFESTIITFGLPYPGNLKVAREVEAIAVKNGAVAATIAIVGGRVVVGAGPDVLKFMAEPKNKTDIMKVARHNMASVLGLGQNGATTVSATMMACDAAGIPVFVTGGIGGVHRGASESFDISSDLKEFEKSKVAVVSSGVKSILDIKLTLEYLETCGVPIIGYKTEEFPAFYSRTSGFRVNTSVKNPVEAARIIKAAFGFSNCGVLVANPIPSKFEINSSYISKMVDKIVKDAHPKAIEGPKYTPYILAKLHELSEGRTLAANVALIKSNAEIGAKLAVELSKL